MNVKERGGEDLFVFLSVHSRPSQMLSSNCMPQILDGNRVRDEIKNELRPRIAALRAGARPPGLAVGLGGNNPAPEIYGRNKIKACKDLGIFSESVNPPDTAFTAK